MKLGLKAWKRRSFWLTTHLPPQLVTVQTSLPQGPFSVLAAGPGTFPEERKCVNLNLDCFPVYICSWTLSHSNSSLYQREVMMLQSFSESETLHKFIKLGKSYSASDTRIYISTLSTPRLFWSIQRNTVNKLKDKLSLVYIFEYSNS